MNSGRSSGDRKETDLESKDRESLLRDLQAGIWSETGKSRARRADIAPEWPFPGWERYRFESYIGRGAMGVVFNVYDPVLNRAVALKVLRDNAMNNAVRFLEEARAQARVDHPNVAKVHEVGEVGGRPFLAMQLLRGRSLASIRGHLCLEERVDVVRQACDGIQSAHEKGLLHRDLKPGNIVVEKDEDGRLHAYVVDFGMALDVIQGSVLDDAGEAIQGDSRPELAGTPAYMSPEQAAGGALDCRSDVFSLGASLYFALTGKAPFSGESVKSVLDKVASCHPDPSATLDASIPSDLAAIVQKALEKNPERRYPTARALELDLKQWLEGEAVSAMAEKRAYRLTRWVKKNRWSTLVMFLLIILLGATGAWSVQVKRQSREQARFYQHFGQEAERMESSLALAETLPLHDTLSARQAIESQMQAIRDTMARFGKAAEGPGYFALGRGYLALGRLDKARVALEKSWDSGLHNTETALALGDCLARIYLAEMQGLGDGMRSLRRKELDRQLKPVLLGFLERARHSSRMESALYAQAHIAWAEGQFDKAIAKADQMRALRPWDLKPVLLKARIYYWQAAQDSPVPQFLDKAIEWIERAKSMGRSSAEVFEWEARIQMLEMRRAISTRNAFSPYLERVLAACGRTKAAHSQGHAAFEIEAQAWFSTRDQGNAWYWKNEKEEAGLPGDMQRVIDCADQALAIFPRAEAARRFKGVALWQWAVWQHNRGQDPRKKLTSAIDIFFSLLRESNTEYQLLGEIATCFAIKGDWEMGQGIAPVASYKKALEYYRQFQEERFFPAVAENMALVKIHRARFEWWQARDPMPTLCSALKDLEEARRPDDFIVDTRMAEAYLKMAEMSAWRGVPNPEALRLARERASHVLAHDPEDLRCLTVIIRADLVESFSGMGKADLDGSGVGLRNLLRAKPNFPEYQYLDAWMALERFRRAPSQQAFSAFDKKIYAALKLPNAAVELHFLAFESCRLALLKGIKGSDADFFHRRIGEHLSNAKRRNPLVAPEADRLMKSYESTLMTDGKR